MFFKSKKKQQPVQSNDKQTVENKLTGETIDIPEGGYLQSSENGWSVVIDADGNQFPVYVGIKEKPDDDDRVIVKKDDFDKPISDEDLQAISDDLVAKYSEQVLTAIFDSKAKDFLRNKLFVDYRNLTYGSTEIVDYILEEVVGTGFVERIISNPKVTDIGWNGKFLMVDTPYGSQKFTNEDLGIDDAESYINRIVSKFAHAVGKAFNDTDPVLDAAFRNIRINAVHKSIAPYGTTLSMRLVKPYRAINEDNWENMAPMFVLDFFRSVMKTGANIVIAGTTGTGKSLTNDTLIPTPTGRIRMGDIKVGDVVFDRSGTRTNVTGVYPQGELPEYAVELSDGRIVYCSEDHLWSYYEANGKQRDILKTATLKELVAKGITSEVTMHGHTSMALNYRLPMNKAVQYSEAKLPIDPYVLGALIGDGSLTSQVLTISSEDDEIPNKVLAKINGKALEKNDANYSYQFLRQTPDKVNAMGPARKFIYTDELMSPYPELMVTTEHKHIPSDYLHSSEEQRWELIRGLFDTDGSISVAEGRYTLRFGTVSERLKDDVQDLLYSLGIQTSVSTDTRKDRNFYEIRVNCENQIKHKFFSLNRKYEIALEAAKVTKRRRYDKVAIQSVRATGRKVEMTCIMVDNEEHLFLANDYVVTHNTEVSKQLFSYVPPTDRIVTIEDVQELHLKTLYPEKDVFAWLTTPKVTIADEVKASLRCNPRWVVVSETRGAEAYEMLQAIMTGHNMVTTLHATNTAGIPRRFVGMCKSAADLDEELLTNDILENFDFGVHIKRLNYKGNTIRYLHELCEYGLDGKTRMLFKQEFRHGKFYVTCGGTVSPEFQTRMAEKSIEPFTFPNLNDKLTPKPILRQIEADELEEAKADKEELINLLKEGV
jgi:Flp pilus assembly CpaF family ATPase